MKKCSICKKLLDLNLFNNRSDRASGKRSGCKKCQSNESKKYRVKAKKKKMISRLSQDPYYLLKPHIKKLLKLLTKLKDKKYRMINKYCNSCSQWLLKSQFGLDADNSTGLSRRCLICRRPYYIIRRGKKRGRIEKITALECWSIIKTFESRCFRCDSTKYLTLDHHHNNKILSLDNAVVLCKACNTLKHTSEPEKFYTQLEMDRLLMLGVIT